MYVTTWMELENIMLSLKKKTHKNPTYYVISFI